MSRFSERLISVLLVLFLLTYAGYQAYRYLYTPYKTETVFDYTVSQSVGAQGIVLRSETLIEQTATGVEHYLFEDGQRVTVGQTVAEFYTSASGGENKYRIREIEAELLALREAQNTTGNIYTNTDSINREIRDQLAKVAQMSSTGRYNNLNEVRPALVEFINKKQIATGRETDFSARIGRLEQELAALNTVSRGEVSATATAPTSGYFCKTVDGYETVLGTGVVGSYTLEEYRKLVKETPTAVASNAAGKVITNQNWYYACIVPKYQVEWLWQGQGVHLNFEMADGSRDVPAVITEIITEKDDEDAALVLQCNQINGDLVALRQVDATIEVDERWGLRVNAGSIHFQGEQRGVYVLVDGTTVEFRKVDPVYETQAFVLSRIDEADAQRVQMYDLVITKGKDLYDEKVVG